MIGSPCSPRDSQESSPTPQFKSINSLTLSFLYSPTLTSIHDYWKNHSLDRWTFVGKVMSLLFNMLSRLVITFLPRSKHLLISRLQSPSAFLHTSKPKLFIGLPTSLSVWPLHSFMCYALGFVFFFFYTVQPTSVPAAYRQRLGNGSGPIFSGMGHYERPRGTGLP